MSRFFMHEYESDDTICRGFTLVNEQGLHEGVAALALSPQACITGQRDDTLRIHVYNANKHRIGIVYEQPGHKGFEATCQASNTRIEVSTYEQALKWVAEQWFMKHPMKQLAKELFGR